MTNAAIILLESVKLMENGILKPTGQKVVVEMADGKKELNVPEVIHTYQKWKLLGYQVKKGSKAVAQFPIWEYTKKKKKDESEEEAQENSHCYMRKASWFTAEQVEKIQEATV